MSWSCGILAERWPRCKPSIYEDGNWKTVDSVKFRKHLNLQKVLWGLQRWKRWTCPVAQDIFEKSKCIGVLNSIITVV